MKVKTAELTGVALDLAVSRASNPEGRDGWGWFERDAEGFLFDPLNECRYSPSTEWAQGGPIIEREYIAIFSVEAVWPKGEWAAESYRHQPLGYADGTTWEGYSFFNSCLMKGSTPLIAAMRAYVSSKLGHEVEIPD